MKQLILGTAGHIDHGKTTLIKALTGIDTDRLKEEKARGISIELGFAHLTLPSGQQLGIVDVPGHERFVKNMLAGATGIDMVLLVVAADDSVMPQTEEHLAIVDLLGIKEGVVALTKADLVDEEWLPLVEDEIRKILANTGLKDAPIVAVSGKTGMGLDKLKETLDEIAQKIQPKRDKSPLRLPIDRVFSMAGAGTVVTGTMWSGEVKVDDKVHIYPAGKEARVRGIQVHGQRVDKAFAGQRTALNLVGIDKDDIARGDVVLAPGFLSPSYMIDAKLKLLDSAPKELKNRARIRLHHGTSEVLGRIILTDREALIPGKTAFVQIRLESPIVPRYNDNFVIRSYSPIQTIGGGHILDSHPAKYKASSKGFAQRCQILSEGNPQAIINLYLKEAKGFMTKKQLWIRSELEEDQVEQGLNSLKSSNEVAYITVDKQEGFILKDRLNELVKDLEDYLNSNLKENPLNPWVSKQVVKSQLFSWMTDKEFETFISYLQQSAKIVVEKAQIAHAKAKAIVNKEDEKLLSFIAERIIDGRYSPPETNLLAKEMGLDLKKVNSLADLLVRQNKLIRVAPNMYFGSELIEQAKEALKRNFTGKEISPSDTRQLLGTSRKYVIPLLNYFDTVGVTRRVGETRLIRS
ncbi:MAG: selenocysteine-specific translation elongation factor [Actinomycetota bacterium]|nr:selenocysteine-specific translation elongation factor [Actinomycetota bacterium]